LDLITSRNNPKIKQARALRQRKARDETGLYLIEGIRPVGEALEAGAPVESILYAPQLLESSFARQLVESQAALGIPCIPTSPQVFESLADKENPQGILAVARQRFFSLHELNPANFPWGVALVSPQDPGNVGTILRTIDAAGASGLLLLDAGVDPYHPASVRASMGALFWHPLVNAAFEDFVIWARGHGYHIFGISAKGDKDYRQLGAYPDPLILLMGSERAGLTQEQAAACEQLVRLPMHGRATSLNLAVAAGVLLYAIEASRQERRGEDDPEKNIS
jgi:TrmH family RNA methyltransferase